MDHKKLTIRNTVAFLTLLISLTVLFAEHSAGRSITVFGPEVYMRGTGSPVTVTKTFAGSNPPGTCTLTIFNGGLDHDKSKKVSSAVVRLNGSQVVGPNEFNQTVDLIQKSVQLRSTNALSVELRGNPGGTLTIKVGCPVMVSVPNVLGLTRANAEAILQQAKLSIGNITEEYKISVQTGKVIQQSPAPGALAEEGTPVHLAVVRIPPADATEIIPDTWGGKWEITTTYRDASTGNIDSQAQITDSICSADPVGITLAEEVAGANPNVNQMECAGSTSNGRIQYSCSAQIMAGICTLDMTAQFDLMLNGDLISGTGSWAFLSVCGLPLPSRGQAITISGRRLSLDPGQNCTSPQSSFLQKFTRNPLFIQFGVIP